MGKILEGGTCRVKIKGKQYIKRENLPVIITSNYSLSDLYPKVIDCNLIRVRVEYYMLGRPLPKTYVQIE